MFLVDGAAVEVGDLHRFGRVREVDHRDAPLVPGLDENVAPRHRHHGAVVRHAVLLLVLRRRNLEVAPELELPVGDVVDGVGAPVERVVGAASRHHAAAPLVGEQHLRAVVVEGRGMPVREALVDHRIHTGRVQWIRDVEQDAVTRAGPGGDVPRREHGDVVTLVGGGGLLGMLTVVAATPETGQRSGFGVREHRGAVHDARLRRILHWNLDDVDAEERRPVIARRLVDAARQFVLFANRANARVVDDDLLVVGGDHRMGVRAAAGLHGPHLHGPAEVADVEDADTLEPVAAHVFGNALEAAVEPSARLLHRHDEQVADDRDIALAARAYH